MSEKKTNSAEPSFKLNYATVVLLLVILIPLIYTIITNLQPSPPAPMIMPVPQSTSSSQISTSTIETALKAVADNPNFQSYVNLGLAYYNAAKYPESIQAWEKALQFNDAQRDVVYNDIAAAYGGMNKWDEEIAACEKALSLNPNLEIAKNNLAWAQQMKNKK